MKNGFQIKDIETPAWLNIDEQGNIQNPNKVAKEMFVSNLEGKPFLELFIQQFREDVAECIGKVVKLKKSVRFETLAKRDGTAENQKEFEVEVTVKWEEDDNALKAWLRDISKQKEGETAIEQSKRLLRALDELVENIKIGIFRINMDGTIEFANPILSDMIGYQSGKKINIYDLCAADISSTDRNPLKLAELMRNEEIQLKKHDDSVIHLLNNSRPLFDDQNNIFGYEGSWVDITRRKEAEDKLQELSTNLKTLFVILTHDLRALLTQFIPQLQLISNRIEPLIKELSNDESDKINKPLNRASKASHEMDAILNDMIIFARVFLSNEPPKAVRIEPIITSLRDELASEFQDTKKYELKYYNNGMQPAGYEQAIKFILRNLIRNALQNGDKEVTRVDVSVELVDNLVHIIIKDNGPGIDPEKLKVLFEPKKEQGRSRGSGIALSLLPHFVTHMKGEIIAKSTIGEGTTFVIKLPRPTRDTAGHKISSTTAKHAAQK